MPETNFKVACLQLGVFLLLLLLLIVRATMDCPAAQLLLPEVFPAAEHLSDSTASTPHAPDETIVVCSVRGRQEEEP